MRVWVFLAALLMAGACASGRTDGSLPGPPTAPLDTLLEPGTASPLRPTRQATLPGEVAGYRTVVGSWELESFSPGSLGGEPRVVFDLASSANRQASVYGFGFSGMCNGHSGSYAIDGDAISINGFRMSLMLCGDLNDDDDVFASFLTSATRWEVVEDQLVLANDDGETATFDRLDRLEGFSNRLETVETVTPRVHFLDKTGFMLAIQEQRAVDGIHDEEQVSWVAWEGGIGDRSADGFRWEGGHYTTEYTWVEGGVEATPPKATIIQFRQRYEVSCVVGALNTLHGRETAVLVANRAHPEGVSLFVYEDTSMGPSDGHTDEVAGLIVADCGTVADGVEFGLVAPQWDYGEGPPFPTMVSVGLTSDWRTVAIEGEFADPVVVAGPSSQNGSDRGVVEIRNVTPASFEIRFHEWDYLDGDHPTQEPVAYLVVERGVSVLPSGVRIEAGTAAATSTLGEVRFTGEFTRPPVLVTTILR